MVIGHGILESKAIPYLEGLPCDSLFFIVDSACLPAMGTAFHEYMEQKPVLSLDIDSEDKGTAILSEVWQWLYDKQASRKSVAVLVGGGTLTDAVGFAVATYMRGLRTVNISTTLLGMVDASVGGKTAIDFAGVKNLVGTFHMPQEVFIDTHFLDTLPIEELYSGFGEVIKTALLSGGELWSQVCHCDPQQMMGEDWVEVIASCVRYKEYIVEQDFKDEGIRSVLNLGHTVAHALESFSRETKLGRALTHGEAVVIGLIVEGYLAYKYLGLELSVLKQLMSLAREHYPQYQYVCKAYPRLLDLMRHDKKSRSGLIRFSLLTRLGSAQQWETADDKVIEEALDFYRETFGS